MPLLPPVITATLPASFIPFSPSLDTPRHSSRMPRVTSDGGSASIEFIRGSHALNERTLEVPLRERRMNAEPLLRGIPYRGDRRLINWP
jgi:hypothetical protein